MINCDEYRGLTYHLHEANEILSSRKKLALENRINYRKSFKVLVSAEYLPLQKRRKNVETTVEIFSRAWPK